MKVRVTAKADAVRVEFLGLSQLDVNNVYIPPLQRKQFEILLCSGRSILLEGSQGAVKRMVALLERQHGARCAQLAFSTQDHPAYRRRVDVAHALGVREVRAVGRLVATLLQ